MVKNLVHSEAAAVSSRLDELGLTENSLREAVNQAHLHRVRLTPHHPRIFAGLVMWGQCVASLRDQLRPLGWYRPEVGNYELTTNDERGLAIAVASGDEATGNPEAHPSNRSPKGRNTVEAVEVNRQLDMFAELIPESKDEADDHETWVLLHYTDSFRKEIRLELSRPSDIGSDGKIREWSERIILVAIPYDDDLIEMLPPNGADVDIEVRRKTR